MTKKDFVKIARILNYALLSGEMDRKSVLYITGQLSVYFSLENELFDKEKFKEAVLKPL
jgi:hypothetical protein